MCTGFSSPPGEGEGDGSWPLSGISSTCHGHSTCFWHPGGLRASGWQGQISSLAIPHLGRPRHCLTRWSLLLVPHIPEMPQWHLSTTYVSFFQALSYPDFMTVSLSWICSVRFVLPVLWNKMIISLMISVIHLGYRWRLANLWELMSESWILIKSPSQPAISISWILNSRQLLL